MTLIIVILLSLYFIYNIFRPLHFSSDYGYILEAVFRIFLADTFIIYLGNFFSLFIFISGEKFLGEILWAN